MLEYVIRYKTRKEMLQAYEMKIDALSLTRGIISEILYHRCSILNSPLYSDELTIEELNNFTCPVADGFEIGSIVATSIDSFKISNEERIWFDWVDFNNFNEICYLLDKIKKEFSINKLRGSIFYKDNSFVMAHEGGLLNCWDVKFGIIIANSK